MIDNNICQTLVEYVRVDNVINLRYNPVINVRYVIPFREEINAYLTCENSEFFINIKHGMNWNETLHAFCHELIHIEQIVRGDLRIVDGGLFYKEVFYSFKYDVVINDLTYTFLPWEDEAIRRTADIAVRMINHMTHDELRQVMNK